MDALIQEHHHHLERQEQHDADGKGAGHQEQILLLHAPLGERQVRIAGILSATNASCPAGILGYIICSEELFTESVGAVGYAAIDIQLGGGGRPLEDGKAADSDGTVSAIRSLLPADCTLADSLLIFLIGRRMASAAEPKQRMTISASDGAGMIAAEAATYAVLGCIAGCVLGLPLNKMMFQFLIAAFRGHPK